MYRKYLNPLTLSRMTDFLNSEGGDLPSQMFNPRNNPNFLLKLPHKTAKAVYLEIMTSPKNVPVTKKYAADGSVTYVGMRIPIYPTKRVKSELTRQMKLRNRSANNRIQVIHLHDGNTRRIVHVK